MLPLLLLLLLLLPSAAPPLAAQSAVRGFSAENARRQTALEERLKAVPQPGRVREYIRVMSEEPHHTGSAAGRKVARYVLRQFRSWGLNAEIEEFVGLMPTPLERRVELLEPERYAAKLAEPPLREDKDSSDAGQLPPYNAYSPDGDVAAQVVYVNYGMPADYEKLDEMGIDVSGKIVLARYMGGWRGIKPKVAAEHGAVGCLIYSDPADDGFYKGDAYPRGPFRPKWGVQRGSTMDMPIHPGDPLSPGWGAEPGGKLLPLEEAKTLPRIPVLPLSWGDAEPILRNLGGPVAPESWRGSVPLTYHLGAGPAKVRMKTRFDWAVTTGENVIARIEGSRYPDEWVIYGNHHDAWVNGATDPVSGNAALMETARAAAKAVEEGWKPKRTIVFASWDAEEWGLIGSTEWVEKHFDELRAKTVVYFNSDSNVAGTLAMNGSHTLERFLNDVARGIDDPRTGKSLWQVAREKRLAGAGQAKKKEIDSRADLRIGALGSGSDYTAFLDHLAAASADCRFRGDGTGVYHSTYDSFDWYRKFGDPDFTYGRALAQFHAVAIARMADADVLPFEFTNYADTIGVYLDELTELAKNEKVDLEAVRKALQGLSKAAENYEKKLAASKLQGGYERVNAALRQVEQAMARDEGLPEREWFKHQVYAPGFYTGYGVKTVPAVREALERGDAAAARRGAAVFARVLAAVTVKIRQAAAALD